MPPATNPGTSRGRAKPSRKKGQTAASFDPAILSSDPAISIPARLAAAKTTAEKLYIFARANKIPSDQQTGKDFCFDKLPFIADQMTLLRIYRLLIVKIEVSSQELREWAAEGPQSIGRNVAVELKNRRREVPDEYCSFFLMNQKDVWDLDDVVDFEAGPDITMAESASKNNQTETSTLQPVQDSIVVESSEGEDNDEAEKSVEKAQPEKIRSREKILEAIDRIPTDNGGKGSNSNSQKAKPIPYKPNSKRYFKRKNRATGIPEEYMISGDGSASDKRGRDSSSPEANFQPRSKRFKSAKN